MSDDETTRVRMPDVVIEDALAAVFDDLASLDPTPKTRELQMRAVAYRRALDQWAHSRPSEDQREALRELVMELHGRSRELRRQYELAETPVYGVPSVRPPPSRRR